MSGNMDLLGSSEGESDISKFLKSVSKDSFQTDAKRKRASNEARALLGRLEEPIEIAFRLGWVYPTLLASIKTATDLNLFRKWKNGGGQQKTREELRALVGCQPALFGT